MSRTCTEQIYPVGLLGERYLGKLGRIECLQLCCIVCRLDDARGASCWLEHQVRKEDYYVSAATLPKCGPRCSDLGRIPALRFQGKAS